MARSARFKELQRRLRELRRHMLPANFSATGEYSPRELDRARGFRLLAHAEIEAFLEDVTFDAAKRSVSAWSRDRTTGDTLFCLIAHYHHGFAVDPLEAPPFPDSSRPKMKESIKELVDVAMKQYKSIHINNNGVKEDNIVRLILPIGIRKDDLDPLWITNLNEFGKQRGDLAHSTAKAQQQIDPKSEWQVVEDLVLGLRKLDELISDLS